MVLQDFYYSLLISAPKKEKENRQKFRNNRLLFLTCLCF